ncbi:MAG: hypothetical protein MI861_19005 [Pirellulales bacterium]|nr:hypothetical protein [Pirellulales bacterium]
MAKKRAGAPNKSQAIREYYASHPNAKPKEVAAELKKKGISVSTAFVSTIRSTSKKKKVIGKPGRPPGSGKKSLRRGRPVGSGVGTSSRASQEVSIESLLKVKRMVEEMGGIGQTRTALTALEKLLD